MLIEIVWYLHNDKWFESQKNAFIDPQTKITGLSCYIVSHCIVLYDVNITIWPLDRSIIAEFTKGFSMMTSLVNILVNRSVYTNDHRNS